jgi:hypothetical protein
MYVCKGNRAERRREKNEELGTSEQRQNREGSIRAHKLGAQKLPPLLCNVLNI